jgi:hypothetical protein
MRWMGRVVAGVAVVGAVALSYEAGRGGRMSVRARRRAWRPPSPPPRSADAVAAEDSADELLGAAILRGRWTVQDQRAMRAALAGADDEARLSVTKDVAVAVNSGRLAVGDLRGPPL